MSDAEADRQHIAALQKRISNLEREAAVWKAKSGALRVGQPDAVQRFASRIAHDFNNLLQSIMGKTDLVMDDASDPEATKAVVQMISDAAVRGAQLTRLLLVFGKTGELPELDVARPKSRAATRRQIISPALSTAPGRILLVEDEEINRDLARKVIERAGHRVAAVANGAEAVAAMQREDFDLVLMDTLMPVMDGLTATRKIRQLAGSRSKVPVIAVTGTALADDVAAFAEAGIDDYIAKPFVFSALVAKIDSWLDRRDGRAADIAKACDAAGAASLSELTNMMGRAWVERGLTQLIEQIDELFEREAIAPTDAAWLTSRSHALVSLAGLLGFADLSHCCSVLEEASRGARDLDAPLAKAKIAATLVRGRTAEMLGSR